MTLDSLRHLADNRAEHRLPLARDRGDLHRHVEGFERDVAVAFAERRLGLELLAIDQALDDDLGVGRHKKIDGLPLDDADRLAGEAPRDAELVEIDGELLRPGEHHHRRGADDDGDRHLVAAVAVFEPVPETAGAGRLARHHAHRKAVGCFQRRAISAHVLHAAVGIAGDAQRRGQIGRGIKTWRRHRHRQRIEPARRFQVVAGDDDFLAWRRRNDDRRNRMVDRRQPRFADLLDLAAHADGINLRRRRQRADHDWDVVFAALGVGDVGEDESAALGLRHAADELPAHQRMQLGILVDRCVDARHQAGGFEIGEMILEIEARAFARRTCAASFVGLVEHAMSLTADAPTVSHPPRGGQSARYLDEFGARDYDSGRRQPCTFRHISRKTASPFCTTPSGHMASAPW